MDTSKILENIKKLTELAEKSNAELLDSQKNINSIIMENANKNNNFAILLKYQKTLENFAKQGDFSGIEKTIEIIKNDLSESDKKNK